MWTPSSERQRLRVVLDTNVWVSAIIWGGPPAIIIRAAEDERILIIVSEAIVEEIVHILDYHRLREIYEEAGLKREELVEAILRISRVVEVKTGLNIVQEDSSDNKFLECAMDGGADYVVSGDDHLLRIGHYQRIRIVSVKQFLEILD